MSSVLEYSSSLAAGTWMTVQVAVLSLLVAIVLGLPTALAKLSVNPVARTISGTYTTIIRGIPDLVIMFLVFYGSQIGINTLGTGSVGNISTCRPLPPAS